MLQSFLSQNGSGGDMLENEFTLSRPSAPLLGPERAVPIGTTAHTPIGGGGGYSSINRGAGMRQTATVVTSVSNTARLGSMTRLPHHAASSTTITALPQTNIPPGSKATVTPAPSSFYDRHVKNALNNINVKSVREWYV